MTLDCVICVCFCSLESFQRESVSLCSFCESLGGVALIAFDHTKKKVHINCV